MTAEILDISAEEYFARPGFSSTLAKVLLAQSPLHAKALVGKKPSKLLTRGRAIHKLVLGKGADFGIVQHKDWKTNDAKAQRDTHEKAGRIPVLAHEFEDYAAAAEAIRVGLVERGIVLNGASECAITWTVETGSGPLVCKGMLDHLWINTGVILDLKVTEDAAPSAVERTSANLDYAVQQAAYSQALSALCPHLAGRIKFLFAFCEPDEPHAMNLSEPDGMFEEFGMRRWNRACNAWAKCLATNTYPGYGHTNHLTTPSWLLSREGYTTDER